MAIELHCEHCGKPVRAPDDSAGKHGTCPSCGQSMYIPTPSEDIEPLGIAPVDDTVDPEEERARREEKELKRRLLHERDLPPERAGEKHRPTQIAEPRIDMETLIVEYAKAMAAGKLSEADAYASDIRRHPAKAEDVLQNLAVDEMPPRGLEEIPRPVLIGFFKQLREKIK